MEKISVFVSASSVSLPAPALYFPLPVVQAKEKKLKSKCCKKYKKGKACKRCPLQ